MFLILIKDIEINARCENLGAFFIGTVETKVTNRHPNTEIIKTF